MSDVDDLFDDPGVATKVEWEELDGRLLLIYPQEKLTGVVTEYGEKEAIRARVVILDGPDAPKDLPGAMVFPLVLQGQLRNTVGTGKPVIGRLGQGEKKKGQKPPWELQKATDADRAAAKRWVEGQPPKDDFDEPPF